MFRLKSIAVSISLLLATSTPVHMNGGEAAKALRYVKNEAFGFGERLEYDVGYKFISAGTAVFNISKDLRTVKGRPCYRASFSVKSHESLAFIYKVTDQYTTWLDIDGIFPWQYTQRLREKNYSKDVKAAFDQSNNKAQTKDSIYDVPPFVHDIVSAFYYVRTLDLGKAHKGDEFNLENFHDGKTHDLLIKVLGRQQVTVTAGTFNCVVVEPVIAAGSPFGFDGRLVLWLSDDDRKIPVKVSTQIPIGTIDAELKNYRGTRGKIDARVVTED